MISRHLLGSAGDLRVAVLATFLLFTSSVNSAERILADVVTDIDFIAPGERVAIMVRLVNPPDSDIIIKEANFAPQFARLRQLMQLPFLSIIDSTGCPLERPGVNLDLRRDCDTMRNDVFPVNPGDSVLLTYLYLEVSDDAPPGTIINLQNLTLRMFDPNDRLLPNLHVERDVVRIVSDPMNPQPLPQLATANPMAGSASVDMSFVLEHPKRVNAGDSFTITASVTNHSSERFTVIPFLPMLTVGNPGRHYRVYLCQIDPCLNEPFLIEPHESLEGLVFNVQHESPVRTLGFWDVDAPYILVSDSLGREAHIYTEPVRIIIDHYTHLPTLSPRPGASEENR